MTFSKRVIPRLGTLLFLTIALFAGKAWALKDLDLYPVARVGSSTNAWQVVIRNNIAYVASDTNGLKIFDVSNPANPVLLATHPTVDNTRTNAALHVALGNNGTKDYAFVALGDGGVDVVKISNPASPQFVTNILSVGDTELLFVNTLLVQPNAGNYLYVANDIFGIAIFRITTPGGIFMQEFTEVTQVFTYGTPMDMVTDPSDLKILFVADFDAGVSRISLYDLAFADVTANTTLEGDAYGVAASAGTVFVAVGDAGLQTVDATTLEYKKRYTVGEATVGDASCRGVHYAGQRAYVSCLNGGVVIVDVSTPTQTRIGGYYMGLSEEANNLVLSGTNLFVAGKGLLVLGTNLLANPQKVGVYRTNDEFGDLQDISAVAVSGLNAFVCDSSFGTMQILTLANPSNPRPLTGALVFDLAGFGLDMTVVGNYAYLAEGSSGLEILDLTVLTNVEPVYLLSLPGQANAIVVTNGYAYLACNSGGLAVVDVTQPDFPSHVGTYDSPGSANGLAYANGYIYLADGSQGLAVIDVANPQSPQAMGAVLTGATAKGVAVSGSYAFVADGTNGLTVINISDPAQPKKVTSLAVGEYATGIKVVGDFAYLCTGLGGLQVVDISKPGTPRQVGGNSSFIAPNSLTVDNNRLYVAAGIGGMPILDLYRPIKFRSDSGISGNAFHAFVSGPTNGQAVRIQRSTNPASPSSWTDWKTLTFPNVNYVELVDTNYPANLRRYYRGMAP